MGSTAASLLITVPLALVFWLWCAFSFVCGGCVFVAILFTMGFGAGLIYGVRKPRGLGGQVGVAVLSVAFLGLLLLGVAMEGAVCLMMAIPIAVPLAAFGGACAHFVQRRRWSRGATPVLAGMLLVFTPGVQTLEHLMARPADIFVVRSSVDIQASPEEVWRQVVVFADPAAERIAISRGDCLSDSREMSAVVQAQGHCVFSTGAFVEPIQIWDEPHLLKFSVTSNPAPMEEWTPYGHIDTPHLHGFLISNGGQFLLTPLPNGGTRLEGTTWYRHGLWPADYWRLWSDQIIHRIHMRVLRHILDEVEKNSEQIQSR
jgi:hypothetical protein